jgi:predicted ATPase/DNA-binding SARP family transcriptional activator/Tfp pilus assembly protein PilF
VTVDPLPAGAAASLATARDVERLADQHADELLTGACPDVLDEAGRMFAAAREDGARLPAGAAWRLAMAHHRRGEYHLALDYCEAADHDAGSPVDRAHLLATHATVMWARGGAEESRALADLARTRAEEAGDDGALAAAWAAQALAYAVEGDRDANQYAYERAIEHAARAADTLTLVRMHGNLGSLHNEAGRYVTALTHLDRAVALADTHPTGLLGAIANINRAEALLGLGRVDEALVEAGLARDLYRDAGSPMLAFALLVEAEVHRTRGNAVRARVAYQEAADRAEATGNAQVLVPALAGLALTTVLDDPAAAASYAKRALGQPAALGSEKAELAAGWVALADGDREAAGHWAQRAISGAGRRRAMPELADALELRALARDDGAAAAIEDLTEAADVWREIGNAVRMEVNRMVAARLTRDRATEEMAGRALQALGVAVDAFRIAGPLQAIATTARPAVEIHTLGSFAVLVGGETVPAGAWPSRKARDLVKILASRRGRPISRETLADLLWPGVRGTSNRLSVALSTARAALDPEKAQPADRYLAADRDQVRLDPTTVALDVAEFERAADLGLRTAAAGDPDAIRLLQAAAALYPAPFLADEPASEWAGEVRDELRGLAMHVRRSLAALLAAAGEDAQATTWLLAIVADDPYDERAHLDLIEALSREGRHGEARRAHRTYAARMAELEIEPRALADALGRPGAAPVAPTASAPPVGALPDGPQVIGRHEEVRRLVELVAAHRWVTVTGVGGIGKSRLAVAAAADLAAALDPVWFVDLATTQDRPLRTVARALGVVEEPGHPLAEVVVDHVRDRRALLVLDNCEHLLDEVAELAEAVLAGCPHLSVLATSRERIGTADEQVLVVPPLPHVNDATGGTRGSPAEALFLERVRAVQPGFVADPDLVAEVCSRCEGLPLAIELAAARCASLGIDGLLAGLDDRLRLLTGSRRRTDRHRSVRAVLDWSHDLLSADEQRLFHRLGIFAAGFDLTAATAVAGDGAHAASEVADLIGRLTDKHLVERRAQGPTSRWRMLDLVRGYARDRLGDEPDAAAVADRYTGWAAGVAESLAERSRRGEPWRADYEAVAADLRAALSNGAGDPPTRLVLALGLAGLEERRGALSAAADAAEEAVTIARATGDAHQLARAALGASVSGMLFGVTQQHRVALLSEALDALGPAAHPLRVRVMARLAIELYWSSDRRRSRRLARDAVDLGEQVGDHGALAQALYARHYVARGPGNTPDRLLLAERVVRHAQLGGETQVELAGRAAHAVDLLEIGDLDAMEREVDALTDAARQLGHPEFQWYAATYRLVLALVRGDEAAASLLAAEAAEVSSRETEYGIGLHFATAVTDLRRPSGRDRETARLAAMADRFPRVVVWRCLLLLSVLAQEAPTSAASAVTAGGAGGEAAALVDEVLSTARDDAHWLLAACLVTEAVAAIPGAAARDGDRLEAALRPYADALAVGGRVAAFRGSVSHTLGVLALARGDRSLALADLTRAVEVHRRMGAAAFHARSVEALERAARF